MKEGTKKVKDVNKKTQNNSSQVRQTNGPLVGGLAKQTFKPHVVVVRRSKKTWFYINHLIIDRNYTSRFQRTKQTVVIAPLL